MICDLNGLPVLCCPKLDKKQRSFKLHTLLYRSYNFDNNSELVAHTAVQEAGERERRDESMIYTENK